MRVGIHAVDPLSYDSHGYQSLLDLASAINPLLHDLSLDLSSDEPLNKGLFTLQSIPETRSRALLR